MYVDFLPYIISAIISGTISLITAVYIRQYVTGISRVRILRALFRHIEIPLEENKKMNLLSLYEVMYAVREAELLLYFFIFSDIILPYFSYLAFIFPLIYAPFYILFDDFAFRKVVTSIFSIFNKNIYKIVNKSWPYFDPYFVQLTIYSIFFTIFEIIKYKLYSNEALLEIIIVLEIFIIIILQISRIFLPKLHSREDFESAIFLTSDIRPRIRVHTNKDDIEGKVKDVKDDLVIDTEKSEVYIPWENIVYFEIIKEENNKSVLSKYS